MKTTYSKWIVHTPKMLNELLLNPQVAIFRIPINIFGKLLAAVADRAIELKDERLDELMMRLTLYSVADPESPDYNKEIVSKYLYGGKNEHT